MNQSLAFEQLRVRNENARRAIIGGMPREQAMRIFHLSPTAYAQLAGQTRMGFVA